MEKRCNRKFSLLILGIAIIFNACASNPQIKPVAPALSPVEQQAVKRPVDAPPVVAAPKITIKKTPVAAPSVVSGKERPQEKPQNQFAKLIQEDDDKFIVLNFEDAELEVVMQTISELVGMNYILGPRVKGRITIQTYKKIPREDLQEVLHSILAVNGFTTVKSGHYYKIIPIATAKQHPINTTVGKTIPENPEDVMVTRIVPLANIGASELSRIIKPLITKGGGVLVHKDTNIVIINELASNLKRLFKIIDLVDVPAESTSGEKIFVYYVENADASKLAGTLNSIYKKKRKSSLKRALAKTAAAKALRKVSSKRGLRAAAKKAAIAGETELEGDMTIVADTEINALLIKTTPRDYKKLLTLIGKLDILPQQVLVEVMIANVKLTDSTSYGLDWAGGAAVAKDIGHLGGSTGSGADLNIADPIATTIAGGSGLSYLVQQTNRFKAMLKLQATKGNLNILSNPHILTADNKEASINIVDQVPILKITYTGSASGGTTPQQTYEYKDAGIKLTVTPKINDKGLVALKVALEVSEVSDGAGTANPTFSKRDVKTELVVQDGQTLILGGLIKEQHSVNRTGIPWLMNIPYLGFLFSSTTDSVIKTELILMITPRVVSSLEEARSLSRKYKKDVKEMELIIKGQGE